MFLEAFNSDSRELQRYLKEVQRVFEGSSKDILRKLKGHYKKKTYSFMFEIAFFWVLKMIIF